MKIYDLSSRIEESLWYYGEPYVRYSTSELANLKQHGYIANAHVLTSHTGTHIECGKHWSEDGESADEIALEKCVGNAKVFQFPCNGQPFYGIDRDMLIAVGGDALQENDICILATGWDEKISKPAYVSENPFITVDAASFLAEKKVKLIGMDSPLLSDPRDGVETVQEDAQLPDYILAENKIPCVLGLVGLRELPKEVFFMAMPLKLKGADGSPIRAAAIER